MNDQKLSIDGLDEIYRRSCSLADEIADIDEEKRDADIRLALMFIKYAQTHNRSGKFDQVYDDDVLISECEKYLMNAGNTAYFDYKLTAYRNNMELLNMLRDALKLLNNHEAEIVFRKNDTTFLDKIHDGHMAEVERLDKEIEMLMTELDVKQSELSKIGIISKRTVQKKNYTLLEKDIMELQAWQEQLMAALAAVEDKYAQYHADYHSYMEYLCSEDHLKISRYFFSENDEDFERVYGISNQFEADRDWLNEKIDMAMNIIGADQEAYQQLQDMLIRAKAHKETCK
jgi:hypothetical protein